jgi:hypothetical protein
MASDQGDRIISLLRNAIRLSSRTYRDVERQLGWRAGTITRLMRGGLGLKIEHLLSILRAIKLSPARFFAVAYPSADGVPSAEERLYRILEQMYSRGGSGGNAIAPGVISAIAALGASGSNGSHGAGGEELPRAAMQQALPAMPQASSGGEHAATTQDEIDEMVRISLRKLLGTGSPDLRVSRARPGGTAAD